LLVFRALASGSSGNAFVLRTDRTRILFDAGLRLPILLKHLSSEGISPDTLSAVFISHEHRDHCVGAADLARVHDVPIIANEAVLRACGLHGLRQAEPIDVGRSTLVGDVEVTSFPISHDAVRPVGFLARTGGRTLAIATDTGGATPEMLEAIALADLVVLEANHDIEMLYSGRYPYHLRRRVSGPTGHLSNAQAAGILAKNVRRPDVDIWLAHLSKENNTQALAMRTVHRTLKAIGLSLSVGVALRDRPSLRWTGTGRPRQLSLFAQDPA
jgi:phosphoribosyl 1,2-cyclic phosphodiesterase